MSSKNPTISFDQSQIDITEGNSSTKSVSIKVKLSSSSSTVVTADYKTYASDATSPSDFVQQNGTLIFNPGELEKFITITISGDTFFEKDETFLLTLENIIGANVLMEVAGFKGPILIPEYLSFITAKTSASIKIINDDTEPTPIISVQSPSNTIVEGDKGEQIFNFVVNLSSPSGIPIDISYSLFTSGTPTSEYNKLETVTFKPGETSKSIPIVIKGDVQFEDRQSIWLRINDPVYGILENRNSFLMIEDNDASDLPKIAVVQPEINWIMEGDGETKNIDFKIALSKPSTQQITVQYKISDFVPAYNPIQTGVINFNPGETVQTVTTFIKGDDVLNNQTRSIDILLSEPSNADIAHHENSLLLPLSGAIIPFIPYGGQYAIIIIDDDFNVPDIYFQSISSMNYYTIDEGNDGKQSLGFKISLSSSSTDIVQAKISNVWGSAIQGEDYNLQQEVITFNPGEIEKEFFIDIIGDNFIERTEAIVFALTDLTNATQIFKPNTPNSLPIIIQNDDFLERKILGSEKNDLFNSNLRGSDYREGSVFDGIEGIDSIVYEDSRMDYAVFNTGKSASIISFYTMSNNSQLGLYSDTLLNIERLKFADINLALDINDNAGEAYRIYEAAFNRKPDAGGLGFWIAQLDKGATLKSVAEGFLGSVEFKALYGSSPTNSAFVDNLYKNILDRTGEKGGVDFWNGVLNNGVSRADVLVSFSESAENKAGVIGSIQSGIEYKEWLG